MKIVHVENKGKGAWGIPIKNKHIEEKLYFDLNEMPDRMPDIKNPTIGTLAMAPFENVWYVCKFFLIPYFTCKLQV